LRQILKRRNVYGDIFIGTTTPQPRCMLQHILAEWMDQSRTFRSGQKVCWREQTGGRVLPAYQRLPTDHGETLAGDKRLIVNDDLLVVFQRRCEFPYDRILTRQVVLKQWRIKAKAGTAGVLLNLQGDLSAAKKCFQSKRRIGCGDTDAEADEDRV